MAKQTAYRIEPTTPAGWYNVVNKATGACVNSVRGYTAALACYRRLNKLHARALTDIPAFSNMPGK